MSWLLAHFIGDFILQTDWMASTKKQRSLPCLIHTLTYLLPFLFTGLNFWQLGLIGLQHYLQDRSNFVLWFMKIKGSADFTKPPFAPWSITIVDNILHICWITLVLQFT